MQAYITFSTKNFTNFSLTFPFNIKILLHAHSYMKPGGPLNLLSERKKTQAVAKPLLEPAGTHQNQNFQVP